MYFPTILIQASSRSWSGAPDWCMNEVNGRPVTALCVNRALEKFPQADIRIIAPEFDRGGRLDEIPAMFPENRISVFYGHDDNPLKRMIDALADHDDQHLIIRVDGLHFGWLPEHAEQMLEIAAREQLDCIKMPDDFPVQLSADIYRISALKKASAMLDEQNNAAVYKVHPKFFMFRKDGDFKCARFTEHPQVSDDWLNECRKIAGQVYIEARMDADMNKGVKAGDQLSFHYELALDYVTPESSVLDCACGPGYGSRMLAEKANKVVAADIDLKTVRQASAGKYFNNITFQTGDATGLDFTDESFDLVTSFETVEHIDPEQYFKEMHRVIKPGGRLILSTPQNSLGHIPVNSQHLREFSLEEISQYCTEHFNMEKVVGIKQGRIIFPEDPKGQNTFIVCRKAE